MSGKIFISYRRDDSRYQARMIYEAFLRRMPRENVFMDIDTIPLGVNFVKVLEGWVEQCEVLLVLMGVGWAGPILLIQRPASDGSTIRKISCGWKFVAR